MSCETRQAANIYTFARCIVIGRLPTRLIWLCSLLGSEVGCAPVARMTLFGDVLYDMHIAGLSGVTARSIELDGVFSG